MNQVKGNVFNIQRYTIHDGPGLRTELFLKGCPLCCDWCSNPEGFNPSIQPGVYRKKCLGEKICTDCVNACPKTGVLRFERGKLSFIDRRRCTNCMKCQEVCPSDAIKAWGKWMSVDECMKVIVRDKGYYEKSGGGVTVSGGESLLQAGFVRALFVACHEEGIQTCCETTFYCNWSQIEKVLPHTDLFIVDLKHMNRNIHKERTGVFNDRILENLRKICSVGKPLALRIPIIPKFNDDMENIKASVSFINEELNGKVDVVQLLSYMRLGEEKYDSLGIDYPMKGLRMNRPAFQRRMVKYADYFNENGIFCTVGAKEWKRNC